MSAELLKRSPLFRDFSPVGLQILARIVRPRILLSGRPLFVEGAPSESFLLLVEGRLRLTLRGPDGRDAPIGSLGPGEHLGELSLLHAGPVSHACGALAEADCKLLEIGKADFAVLREEKPQACIKFLLALGRELAAKVAQSGAALRSAVGRFPVK